MNEEDKKQDVVASGVVVSVAYTLALVDGTEVDVATHDEPFEFTVGDGALIAGLESVLIGLQAGDQQQFLIAATEAFGLPDPDQVHTMPRNAFQAETGGADLEPGTIFSFEAPSGDVVPATIVSLREEEVDVDFNHPLAGRDLQFSGEVISVGEECNEH